jgi:hypothetical protein
MRARLKLKEAKLFGAKLFAAMLPENLKKSAP